MVMVKSGQMILQIDTAEFEKAKLALKGADGKIVKEVEFEAGKKLSERLLPQIERLLGSGEACPGRATTREGMLKGLTGIKVNLGPGSFTGLRIGVAVANALGYALNIPVNGQKMVVPAYGRKANITIKNPKF